MEALPKGQLPVIRFTGHDWFAVSNSAALRLPEFSIYAVAKVVTRQPKPDHFL